MNKKTIDDIHAHMIAEFPREGCGLIVSANGKERYLPCRNADSNPEHGFIVHSDDSRKAAELGEIIALVHSHPNGTTRMSEADKVMCSESDMPWYIVAVSAEGVSAIERYEPDDYEAPLIGRSFSHGVLDCYTLIQDYYKRELNIDLPHFEREDNWWNKGDDLYMQHFRDAGFEPINGPIAKHDVIIMQIRSPVPNHAGVFVGEPDRLLHHMYNRLSTLEVYGGWYQEITRIIVRRPDVQ